MTSITPRDPSEFLGIPDTGDPFREVLEGKGNLLKDVMLPEGERSGEELETILSGEGNQLLNALSGYGLEHAQISRLDEAIHENEVIVVRFSQDERSALEPIKAVTADGITTATISTNILRVVIGNTLIAVRPIVPPEEYKDVLRFISDTGVRMAYDYALGLCALKRIGFDWLAEQHNDDEEVRGLLAIGRDSVPEIPNWSYVDFLQYRIATRLAFDRLEDSCRQYFHHSPELADEISEDYLEIRKRSLEAALTSSYSPSPTLMDIASMFPLSHEEMQQFFTGLSGQLSKYHRIF